MIMAGTDNKGGTVPTNLSKTSQNNLFFVHGNTDFAKKSRQIRIFLITPPYFHPEIFFSEKFDLDHTESVSHYMSLLQ